MKMVSVIINYCSNEKIFLDAVLTECLKFSNDIVLSYGDHLYDGTPEDHAHIAEYQQKYPTVIFVSYPVDVNINLSKQKGVVNRPTAYYHNLARYTGVQALKKKEWVFILDCDEIPEGRLVKEWLEKALLVLKPSECYKIANYWYFKDPTNQSTTLEDSVLLIHHSHLTEANIFGDFERDHLIPASGCLLRRQVYGLQNAVLFHHYSWVRPRAALEHKIRTWGHSSDAQFLDPQKLIDHIFKDDNVNDIVHRYSYNKVYNKFNIKLT